MQKNGKAVNGRKALGEFNSTKGEIVLDIGSDNVVATALHEVTHYAKINAPTQYNALRDAVLEHTTKSGKMKYYLEKYSNTYRTNNVYEIAEEMTADVAEALLTNEKFIDELFNDKDFINAVVGENKGFVRKFLDTLHDIISSIKDYLKGRTVNHQIARELSEDVKALEKIEKLWRDALTAAVNNHAEISNAKENTDTQSSGVQTMYSSIKKDSLVTAANAEALTETSETTSNTAIFNTTISQSDSDVNSSIHSKEKNITKFSITEDMSEQERYEELKDKSIVISKPDMSKVSDIDIEAYKNLSTKEAKKPIRRIAEMLGIHNVNYKNSNIDFDFGFSKKNLDVSLHHQGEYGGNYADYAEMLTCLDKLVENAELIEIHKNYKDNEYLKNTFVLISAINNDGNIAPVQLEVKEYDKGQSNSLYLNVILSKIKKSAVVKGEHNGNTDISNPLVADFTISLSQLFANVNPSDKRFLKYVPDNFLSAEQIEVKREAQKIDYNKYGRYVEVFENDKDGGNNKFSLSEPVEEKGNLIAVHNIYTDRLVKSLKLGGFPMSSIVVSKPDMSKVSDIDIEAYKNLSTKEAKKPIRKIAEMLGIHNVNYKNSNIKFDFAFSKSSLDTSLNHQREYGGSYTDYAEMLTCLEKLVENAELIEVHENYKSNLGLKKTYVLISAFSDNSNVVPVQLEVKNFENQPNGLYLNVVLSKIKKSAVVKGKHNGNTDISNPLVADSAISLSQLFANLPVSFRSRGP